MGGANYGSSGQVLTSQGSGSAVQWASPSGTIIQTIKKRLTSSTSTTSGSYQEVLSQAITLSSSSNKVIIVAVCQCQGWGDRDRRANTGVFHTNVNTSNQFSYGTDGEYHTAADGSPPYSFGVTTHYIIDTPGSTSRTYKIGLRSEDGSNVGVQGDSSYDRSYIILQEITA